MKPLRSKGNRAPVSTPEFIPAPTKGWYVGRNLAESEPGTALVLNNAFPREDYVRARRGTEEYASLGISDRVLTLIPWINGSANRMFAAAQGSLYEVTNPGPALPTGITGQASDYWQYIQFDPTGSVIALLACNGLNSVLSFDGVTWSQNTPAITGPTNPISNIWAYNSRVFLVEANTTNAWYLGLAAIGGPATLFQLGGIFTLGGTLIVGSTWAIDSSIGSFQSCIFISSEGEVAMFGGTFPGDPSWTLRGLYKISRPLGARCIMRAGGDIGILTEDGIVAMSKVLTLDQEALQNEAVTLAIAPAWREAVDERQGAEGWQITIWPLEGLGIVNLPKLSTDDLTQFVTNVRTGAWAQYIGWDANCFAVFDGALYYGTSDGRVMQGEVGGSDDGVSYSVDVFPGFTALTGPSNQKVIKLVRYFFQTNINLQPQITINVEFNTLLPAEPTAITSVPIGALYGTAIYGVDIYPILPVLQQNWSQAPGFGTWVSPVMQLTINSLETPDIRMTGIEILTESGFPIG